MINKIKRVALVLAATLSIAGAGVMPSVAFAACSSVASDVASGVNAATVGSSANCASVTNGGGETDFKRIASNIVKYFSWVVGVASIVMIIYSGFRYITSGGSSDKVGAAKNGLIYAIVGLVIVAISQLIVHFVLNASSQLGS